MIAAPDLAAVGARLDPQPFESGLLGGPAFRLALHGADATRLPATLGRLADWAAGAGVRLITARVPAGANDLSAALDGAGFLPIERLVTLERPLDGSAAWPPNVRLGAPADVAPCGAIARASFRHDRFHVDTRLPAHAADALKAQWVANAFAGRADACFVATDGDRVVGFNLCLRDGDAGVIDLIAVAPAAQGRGHGMRLIAASIAHYTASGARRLRVGTQRDNDPSMALYRTAGFVPVAEAVTFHLLPAHAPVPTP